MLQYTLKAAIVIEENIQTVDEMNLPRNSWSLKEQSLNELWLEFESSLFYTVSVCKFRYSLVDNGSSN